MDMQVPVDKIRGPAGMLLEPVKLIHDLGAHAC